MKYKIYIPSKGRCERSLTADLLIKHGIDFKLVVEKDEFDIYSAKFPNNTLSLPDSNYGSVAFARNFIKQLSIDSGEEMHWQLDDDIAGFIRIHGGKITDIDPDTALSNCENFVDIFKNVGIAGLSSSVFVKFQKNPFEINKLAYTSKLIKNSIHAWWEKGVIDDIDYNIKVLESGNCTIRFNAYGFKWQTVTSQKGGFTEIYMGKDWLDVVVNTQKKWGLGKIKERVVSGNKFYSIDYAKKFKDYPQTLIKK